MDNDMKTDLDLLKEFPPPSRESWVEAVKETLKGADFDKVMKTKTYEGITLEPIYTRQDLEKLSFTGAVPGQFPFLRGNDPERFLNEGWYIAQLQSEPELKELNRQLLSELGRGLTAVNLKLMNGTIKLSTKQDLETAFAGIDLSAAPLFAQTDMADMDLVPLLLDYFKAQGYDLSKLNCGLGFDPTGEFAREGNLPMELDSLWQRFTETVRLIAKEAPNWRCISIDGTVYEAAGASSTQELAFVLSTAIGYIQGLMAFGLSAEEIIPRFQVRLSLGSNFYMEIAKVRAFRLLWAEMVTAFGLKPEMAKVWIHGVTADFNKTMYDKYVNILRTGTEAFAGVIGGVDSLEVSTFDELLQAPTEFSKRIARNQQILLAEEAHFGKVIDPAGGCYYIESLTSELAGKAWSMMQELETSGGMIRTLKAGGIHSRIEELAKARVSAVDKRRDVFVGINMFANPQDETPAIAPQTASIRKVAVSLEAGALPKRRAVMNVEQLRMKLGKASETHNLKVFLLNMGSIEEFKARADFATGFLQVGGFEVLSNLGFASVQDAANAAHASGANAFCICSTDDNYQSLVPELCAALPGKVMILAGYPTDKVEDYKTAGIKTFIHIRADVTATLSELAGQMGVSL